MRCVLVIMLLSAATVFALDSTSLEYNSGDNPDIPHVTDDEDLDDGSGSGDFTHLDEVTDGVTQTTLLTDPDMDTDDVGTVPRQEVENGNGRMDEEFVEIDVEVDFGVKEEVSPVNNAPPNEGAVLKSSVFESGHFLTAAIIGGCIGFLFAVALIMLLLYRMRKKDEGSYALDDQKKHGAPPAYQYTQGQEYYA